jgi:hypothetical protein
VSEWQTDDLLALVTDSLLEVFDAQNRELVSRGRVRRSPRTAIARSRISPTDC